MNIPANVAYGISHAYYSTYSFEPFLFVQNINRSQSGWEKEWDLKVVVVTDKAVADQAVIGINHVTLIAITTKMSKQSASFQRGIKSR